MTAERAAYHRLMLLAGLQEEFETELTIALETEDPISDLILDLAFCMSDLNGAVSILYSYTIDHAVDEQQVYDMILHKFRQLYADKRLNAAKVCEALSKIQRSCDFVDPWIGLYPYLYDYELMTEGFQSQEVFEANFGAAFLREKRTNDSALKKDPKQKNFVSKLIQAEQKIRNLLRLK